MSKFTDEQVTHMVDLYTTQTSEHARSDAVTLLAGQLGVSEKSIMGKLVSEKVYIKKASKTSGAAKASKEDYSTGIKIMVGAREEELPTLKNMSVKDLIVLSELLVRVSDLRDAS